MDNTPIFIKMCEQFAKIQNSDWVDGDYFYCPDLNKTIIYNFVHTNVAEMGNFPVKLFRQDQLQEMIKYNFDIMFPISIVRPFYKFVKDCFKNKLPMNTMEQLWLAFVMFEKFNKKWNGNDWVKI